MTISTLTFESPVGRMELVAEEGSLTRAHFLVERVEGEKPAVDNASGLPAPAGRTGEGYARGGDGRGGAAAAKGVASSAVAAPATDSDSPVLREAQRQFEAYFAGEQREFDVPMAARGTAFQRRIWEELTRIPYGVTASYGEIAARLGMPAGASRAVGTANGANPIAIIVPCHRVIGANRKLVGYAGGLDRKRLLLNLESTHSGQAALFA